MKLKQYLTEQHREPFDVEEFNYFINKDCKQYLRLIKGKQPLIRVMQGSSNRGVKKVRQHRHPQGTSPEVFKIINKWLEKQGHNRRDNSFMCTSWIKDVWTGPTDMIKHIFPIGNFSYTWMDARDWNIDYPQTGWDEAAPNFFADDPDGFEEQYGGHLPKPFADYFHTDKGFDKAYKNKFEIWIHCKQYYYVTSEDLFDYGWDARAGKAENVYD